MTLRPPSLPLLLGLAAAGSLCGCASIDDAHGYPGFDIQTDGDTVKVISMVPGMDPYPVAVQHCEQQGRDAQMLETSEARAVVTCIARR